MSFDQYWRRLENANAALGDESATMKITVAQFRQQLRKAWDACVAERADLVQKLEEIKAKKTGAFDKMFEDLFGGATK